MSWKERLARPEPALFFAALLPRLSHLALYKDDFWLVTPLLDDQIFVSWAQILETGGWLGRTIGNFDFNPAYPYFLALLGKTIGRGPVLVYALQHLLGALVPVVIYRIALQLFGRRSALWAGGLAVLYGPAYFFESRFLGEHFIYLFNALFLLCLVARPKGWPALAGLSLGLSAVFRPTALILAPLAAAWVIALLRGRAAVPLLIFGLAAWLPLIPFQLRNRVVVPENGWGLTTSSGGVAFHMGNNAEADGLNKPPSFVQGGPGTQYQDYKAEAERRLGRALSPKEVSRFWAGRALEWFKARPAEAWTLVWRKAGYFFNHKEPPDNFFLAIFKRFTALGPVPLPGWGLIVPLGLVGAALALMDWRSSWLLHGYLASYLAVNAAFLVLSRYRFPAAAALIPFAGLALSLGADAWRSRRRGTLLGLAAGLAAAVFLTRLPLIGEEDPAVSHYSMGVVFANQGWTDKAVAEYRAAAAADPAFKPAHLNLGLLLAEAGRFPEAVSALEAARRLETDPAQAAKLDRAIKTLGSR